jgi:hypothetical protein
MGRVHPFSDTFDGIAVLNSPHACSVFVRLWPKETGVQTVNLTVKSTAISYYLNLLAV